MNSGMRTKSPRWRVKHVYSSNSHVPARSGLYAIGHDDTYRGLEIGRVYVYVGRTDNLRRRLGEHIPVNEQNPGLKDYLLCTDNAKCWYTVMDKSELKNVEKDLIRKFQPCFNRIGK